MEPSPKPKIEPLLVSLLLFKEKKGLEELFELLKRLEAGLGLLKPFPLKRLGDLRSILGCSVDLLLEKSPELLNIPTPVD